MDTKKLAQSCVQLVGGKENIQTAAHCQTRLRFTLADPARMDVKGLEALEDVLGVQQVGSQTQIIIGPGVNAVFAEVNEIVGDQGAQSDGEEDHGGIVSRILDVVSGIFGPIIPVITACGMVKAVMAVLVLLGLSKESQEYYLINMISDAGFYFFPIMIGFSAGKKFGANPYFSALLGAVLVHPNWSALVTAAEPVSFFGLPVQLHAYASSVLPIILISWVMSYVQRFAEKISPKFIKAILVPLLVLGVTGPLALMAIGPIGAWLGYFLADAIEAIDATTPFLVPTLMGAFWPLLVFVGMHTALTPLASIQLTSVGHEIIQGPGALASNIAQGAASLATALRLKDPKNRSIAFSAAATALCGISEPALYGVNFKYKKPMIAVIVGGGIAGLYAGISGLVRYSFGSPALPTLPVFIGEDPNNIVKAAITIAIAFVATFVIAWVLGVDEGDVEDASEPAPVDAGTKDAKLSDSLIFSPLDGELVKLEDVKDAAFASGVLGAGVGILPANGEVVAPCDGSVVSVFPTKHAIGILSDGGAEVLIHMGINTVELKGDPFDLTIAQGDRVSKGEKIGTMDVEAIVSAGMDPTTIVTVGNTAVFTSVNPSPAGDVTRGAQIISAKA